MPRRSPPPCPEWHLERRHGRLHLHLALCPQGADWLARLWGGTAHIGAAALGLPQSESGGAAPQELSPLCRSGHREAELAQKIADRLAQAAGSAVCCCAGIHYEGITPEEIALVLRLANELTEEAARQLRALPIRVGSRPQAGK